MNEVTSPDLARQVDAAQSILATPAADECRRLEHAVVEVSRAFVDAMLRLEPSSGAVVRDVAGGVAVFAGVGSPLSQGLAMGLHGPVSPAELDAFEAVVAPGGDSGKQLEIGPFVDPSLPSLLAERGYRVHEWQLVWTRAVPTARLPPPPPGVEIRRLRSGEEEVYLQVIMAAFLETEDVPDAALSLMRPAAYSEGTELFLAWHGDEAIGAGAFSAIDGVAMVNGSGVRPKFRRRGAQGALIRARLDRARELGCDIAVSSTLPGTASRRNMERHGFSVAYPKLVMLKSPAGG